MAAKDDTLSSNWSLSPTPAEHRARVGPAPLAFTFQEAEQFSLIDAAEAAYNKVERPKTNAKFRIRRIRSLNGACLLSLATPGEMSRNEIPETK